MKLKHKGSLLLAAILITLLINNRLNKTNNNIHYEEYIVSEGQTLWSICEKNNTYDDVREMIYEVRKVNNITPIIQAGQTILIPVREEK
jgi:hypothetical protein